MCYIRRPLNVVISAESDPLVLTEEGFFDFMLSVQMGGECLGQHMASKLLPRLHSNPLPSLTSNSSPTI